MAEKKDIGESKQATGSSSSAGQLSAEQQAKKLKRDQAEYIQTEDKAHEEAPIGWSENLTGDDIIVAQEDDANNAKQTSLPVDENNHQPHIDNSIQRQPVSSAQDFDQILPTGVNQTTNSTDFASRQTAVPSTVAGGGDGFIEPRVNSNDKGLLGESTWQHNSPVMPSGLSAIPTHQPLQSHQSSASSSSIATATDNASPKLEVQGTELGIVKEDTVVSANGKLDATSNGQPEANITWQVTGPDHALGTLSINPDGSWSYQLDSSSKVVQALAEGQLTHEQFVITGTDSSGNTSSVPINIVVQGTNDIPQITQASVLSGQVFEDGNAQVGGVIGVYDPDAGTTLQWQGTQQSGVYGDFHFDSATRQWEYQLHPGASNLQQLAEGQQVTETFTLAVTDEHGGSTTTRISVNITGTNDVPMINSILPQTVDEGAQIISGQFSGSDIDSGDTLTWSTPSPIAGFIIKPDGSYSFDPADSHYEHLASGQQQVIDIPVTVTDDHGAASTRTMQITVTGTNDQPVMTLVPPRIVHEDDPVLQGQLSATDPDSGDTLSYSAPTPIAGFSINPDGTYTFDAGDPAYQHLSKGQQQTLDIPVQVTDPHGGIDTQILHIGVIGTNDAPILSVIPPQAVKEDGAVIQGKMTSTDVDDLDTVIYGTTKQVDGFVLMPDGHYSFDASHPAYQNLAEGETRELRVPLSVMDSNGATDAGELLIQVTGTNDLPQISAIPSVSLNEGDSFLHGQVSATDIDRGDSHSFTTSATTAGFTLNPDGSYVFDPADPSYDHLAPGDHLTLQIPIVVTDNHGGSTSQTLEITINGSNDTPVVSSAVSLAGGSEDNDVVIKASDLLAHASDVDTGDSLTVMNLSADHGSITDNHDGTFTFHPDQDYNGKVTFSYDAQDAHGASTPAHATMDLAAVGDASVIAGQDSAGLTEDGNIHSGKLEATGQLTIVDPDAGEDHFIAETRSTGTGTFDVKSDGAWTYSADNSQRSIQELGAGETLTDSVWVQSPDGGHHKISVTITGTNDVPTVSAAVALNPGTEDTDVTIHANDLLANAGDADINDRLTVQNLHADHGTITDNHNGTYTFSPDKDYNGKVTLSYDVQDGHGASVLTSASLQLAAVGDAATFSGNDSGGVIEDKDPTRGVSDPKLTATGHLDAIDADAGESNFGFRGNHSSAADQFGGNLRIDQHGTWYYSVSNKAVQHLSEGEQVQVTHTIHSADGTPHDIVITITGTNDAPVISSTATLSAGAEDTDYTLNAADLLAHATDVDTGETAQLTVHNVIAVKPDGSSAGTVTDNKDGTFTFHPEANYNGAVSFNYEVQDPQGASASTSASLSLAAVGDAAVIGGVDTGSVTEASAGADMSPDYAQPGVSTLNRAPLYADGKLTITDPDTGEAVFDTKGVGYSYHGQYGDLILQENGVWHYKADAGHLAVSGGHPTTRGTAIDQLGEGQSLTDTITIYAKDGTAHDIVITIHGSNDKPYCSSEVVLQSGTEDNSQTLTTAQLLANTVDVDGNDAGQLSISNLRADHGSIRDNGDGTYAFSPDRDYNGDVHFSYDVQDGHGGVTHTGATTNLAAVADAATFSGTDTGGVIEDKDPTRGVSDPKLTATGHLDAIDADAGESNFGPTGSHSSAADQFGGNLRVDKNGTWYYSVSNSAVQHLSEGQQVQVTHTVHSADGTAHDIVITITGTNDAPVISSTATLTAGSEDTDYTLHASDLLAHATDVDTGETAQLSVHNLVAVKPDGSSAGTVTDNADGTFTFHPDVNYNGAVTFNYDVQDSQGASVSTSASLQLAAVDDAAVITAVGKTLKEDVDADGHYNMNATGYFQVVDPDGASQSHFETGASGRDIMYTGSLGGTLQLYSSGHYYYNLNNYLVDHLKEGEEVKDHFTIRSADGTTQQVEFTIRGTNDAPYIDGNRMLHTVFEGGGLLRGQFSGIDPDHGDAQHLVYSTTASIPGFTLNSDGSYTFNPADKAYDHVSASTGQDEHIIIPITVTDPDGLETTQNLRINMIPGNDAPVVSSAVTLSSGTEDHSVTIHERDLLAHASDVDDYDQLNVTSLHADHGTIVDNHDHTYTFTPDANYNGKVTFSYQVEDNHGASTSATASMNLAAVRDAATFTGQDAGSVTEDQHVHSTNSQHSLLATGALDVHDPDAGEEHFQFSPFGERAISDPFGGELRIDRSGSWQYEVNNDNPALQALKGGETRDVVYRVRSADGTEHHITITVTGTNDAPVVSSAATLTAGTEDTDVTFAAAQLLAHASDADAGETAQLSIHNLSADHGTITDNGDGTFTFHPEANYNGQVSFTYDVQDPQGANVAASATMNLAAVADAATFSGTDTGDVIEDKDPSRGVSDPKLTATGHLNVIDADAGQSNFGPTGSHSSAADQFGGNLRIDQHGTWYYSVSNSAVQHLSEGQQVQVTHTIHSADGTAHDIVITITGTNDAPAVSANTALAAGKEDTAVTIDPADLLTHASDIDTGDAAHLSIANLQADHGTITANADGTFAFTPEKDYNGQVTFSYDVQDSHGASTPAHATMDLAAVNDGATLVHSADLTVTEDQAPSVLNSYWNNIDIADKDGIAEAKVVKIEVNGVEHTMPADFATTIQGSYGTFHFTHSTDGHDKWYYSADNTDGRIQGLDASQNLTDTMTLITADGTRLDVRAIIQGTDDGVIIDTPDALTAPLGIVTEDSQPSVSGTLQAHDVDTRDSVSFTPQTVTDAHGTFTVNAQGQWSYTLDPTTSQSLSATDHFAIPFYITATSSDGSTATKHVEVFIQGTNDAPTVSANTALAAGSEDTAVTIDPADLLAHASDIDTGDAAHLSIANLQADHGTITANADGTFAFTPEKDYNGKVTFSYDAQDAHGASTPAHATMDLAAVGDASVIAGQDSAGLTEDGNIHSGKLEATGQLTIVDPDAGEDHFIAETRSTGTGTFDVKSDGAWTYSADNSQRSIQELGAGETLTDSVWVQSPDGGHHKISVTITGTNDVPTVSAAVALNPGTEDTDVTIHANDLLANAGDADINDRLTVQNLHADHGTITDNHNGTYTFSPDKDYNGKVSFSYDVHDGHGGSTAATASLNLAAVPDIIAPAGLTHSMGAGHDWHAVLTPPAGSPASGGWGVKDEHTGSIGSSHQGQYGTLRVDPQTGAVTYHADANQGGVQKTGTGQTGDAVEHFTITLGGQTNSQIEVEVHLQTHTLHGSSGHFQQQIVVTGMDIHAVPGVSNDEPDQDLNQTDSMTLTIDADLGDGSTQSNAAMDVVAEAEVSVIIDGDGAKHSTDAPAVTNQDATVDQVAASIDGLAAGTTGSGAPTPDPVARSAADPQPATTDSYDSVGEQHEDPGFVAYNSSPSDNSDKQINEYLKFATPKYDYADDFQAPGVAQSSADNPLQTASNEDAQPIHSYLDAAGIDPSAINHDNPDGQPDNALPEFQSLQIAESIDQASGELFETLIDDPATILEDQGLLTPDDPNEQAH